MPKPGGKPQTARFYDGLFKVTQPGAITQLELAEALAPCGKGAHAAAKKPKTRRLWGNGKGSFRISGQYSAATVRGTKWLVQDSCASTLTRVTSGAVSVRDSVRHKTVVVRAGHRYLAKPSTELDEHGDHRQRAVDAVDDLAVDVGRLARPGGERERAGQPVGEARAAGRAGRRPASRRARRAGRRRRARAAAGWPSATRGPTPRARPSRSAAHAARARVKPGVRLARPAPAAAARSVRQRARSSRHHRGPHLELGEHRGQLARAWPAARASRASASAKRSSSGRSSGGYPTRGTVARAAARAGARRRAAARVARAAPPTARGRPRGSHRRPSSLGSLEHLAARPAGAERRARAVRQLAAAGPLAERRRDERLRRPQAGGRAGQGERARARPRARPRRARRRARRRRAGARRGPASSSSCSGIADRAGLPARAAQRRGVRELVRPRACRAAAGR